MKNFMINQNKIHFCKRNKVEKVCQLLSQYSFVEKMIIFGSATTNQCSDDSDLDICLVLLKEYDKKRFTKLFGEIPLYADDLCDILVYHNLNEKWKNEIDKKGVVVYEFKKS